MLSLFKRLRWTKPQPITDYPDATKQKMVEWIIAMGMPPHDVDLLLKDIFTREGTDGRVTLEAWNALYTFVGSLPSSLPPEWDWRTEKHNSNTLLLWSITQWFQMLTRVSVETNSLASPLIDALEYTIKVARYLGYDVDLQMYPGALRDNFARVMGCDNTDVDLLKAFRRWGAWSEHIIFHNDATAQSIRHPSDWVLEEDLYLHDEITLQF